MRCLTITLNTAVDTTYTLGSFHRGQVNRVSRSIAVPGGKGNNVAKVLSALGHSVIASGIIAGRSGQFIEQGLRSIGIETSFLVVPGESRVCLTLLEKDSGTVSELLEPGIRVSLEDGQRFLRHVTELVDSADAVVVSGSLPAGLPPDYYARLLSELRTRTKYLAFDSSGEALRLGLAGRPDLVKPNEAEMRALAGGEPTSEEMIEFARGHLIGRVLGPGAQVLLSLGARGACLIGERDVWIARPPAIDVVSPVGAGDALLAGFLSARSRDVEDRDALRRAVAVGAVSAMQEVPGAVDVVTVTRLEASVEVEPFRARARSAT